MNIHALYPLAATLAYIPLIISTLGNRPWQKQHKLFLLFLLPAMLWSLVDFFLRGFFFVEYSLLLGKLILILSLAMYVQLHCFTSSFFGGPARWLPFAYGFFVGGVLLIVLGGIPRDIVITGDKLQAEYGPLFGLIVAGQMTLAVRNFYVLGKRLRVVENPFIYNQTFSIILAYIILVVFGLATAFLPWNKEFPLMHLANLLNAFLFSYAVIRHRLVDIRTVLRRVVSVSSLALSGAVAYMLLFYFAYFVLHLEFNLIIAMIATGVALLASIIIYRLRGYFFVGVGRAFHGHSYDYRVRLSNFTDRIHNVFSLKEQGNELLALVIKAFDTRRAALLFLEAVSDDFTVYLVEPDGKENPLSRFHLGAQSPIVKYLQKEHRVVTREMLSIVPEFRSLWETEKEEIGADELELFVPLISRDHLIGILVMSKKAAGNYSLEDLTLLEEVTGEVAVSMEKEYLRERLNQREAELSLINRSSAIIASSLNIQEIYDTFIGEIRKVIDISWAAISLIETSGLYFLAISTEIGSAWKVGERIPLKGTAAEYIATHHQSIVETDLTRKSRFSTATYQVKQGLRSIAYLPLVVKGEVIGLLVVASRLPNAYSARHLVLLEQLAAQIAMPVENARLYADVEEKAYADELTGLLNRRSLDEVLPREISRHCRYGGAFSLIILDLDGFKAINDRFGHLTGDKLLRETGNIMKNAVRGADQVFRYGGDEFAIILPQTPIDTAYEVGERVRQRIALIAGIGYTPLTVSMGLASWPISGLQPNEIIAAADAALYQSKRDGGNRCCRASTVLPSPEAMTVDSKSNDNSQESWNILNTLLATLDARDHYSQGHAKRVGQYAVLLAQGLKLDDGEIKRLEYCAQFHDIGKVSISEEILNKTGRLTPKETEAIKAHPQMGATIVSHIPELVPCVTTVLHHHENYDGSGYPRGLKGEDIPLSARILNIANTFDTMTSAQDPAESLPVAEALAKIKEGSGKQFDPRLVEVFLSVMKTPSPL